MPEQWTNSRRISSLIKKRFGTNFIFSALFSYVLQTAAYFHYFDMKDIPISDTADCSQWDSYFIPQQQFTTISRYRRELSLNLVSKGEYVGRSEHSTLFLHDNDSDVFLFRFSKSPFYKLPPIFVFFKRKKNCSSRSPFFFNYLNFGQFHQKLSKRY